MIYFTSDLHLSHYNIIKYCNRPYKDINEMNIGLIDNFNSIITPKDQLFILGDLAMMTSFDNLSNLISKFNGKKTVIIGNHDHVPNMKKLCDNKIIEAFYQVYEMKFNNQYFWLSHYPHLSWNHSAHGSIHLYGHVHGKFANNLLFNGLSMDVGVDCNDYKPIAINNVTMKMQNVKNILAQINENATKTENEKTQYIPENAPFDIDL